MKLVKVRYLLLLLLLLISRCSLRRKVLYQTILTRTVMVYLDKMKVLVCDTIFKEKLYIKCGATLQASD